MIWQRDDDNVRCFLLSDILISHTNVEIRVNERIYYWLYDLKLSLQFYLCCFFLNIAIVKIKTRNHINYNIFRVFLP